jgi:hypothetical protein
LEEKKQKLCWGDLTITSKKMKVLKSSTTQRLQAMK